jgi:hypothetical protein
MEIYWDNKIYGIRWYKVDELEDSFCLIYEYKSNQELNSNEIKEIKEIKQNFELINHNELSKYQFYLYNQASPTLEPNSEPFMLWNKVDVDNLKTVLN